jgi:pentatricopeptide repeat protein
MPVRVTAKAWGALLAACRKYGDVGLAEIAARALFEIEPENAGNFVSLANIYSGLGMHEEAERVRRDMEQRGVQLSPGSSWMMHHKSRC